MKRVIGVVLLLMAVFTFINAWSSDRDSAAVTASVGVAAQ